VGTGVIGASWAAQYLARGFDNLTELKKLIESDETDRRIMLEFLPLGMFVALRPEVTKDQIEKEQNNHGQNAGGGV
jgi:hypothetical protein